MVFYLVEASEWAFDRLLLYAADRNRITCAPTTQWYQRCFILFKYHLRKCRLDQHLLLFLCFLKALKVDAYKMSNKHFLWVRKGTHFFSFGGCLKFAECFHNKWRFMCNDFLSQVSELHTQFSLSHFGTLIQSKCIHSRSMIEIWSRFSLLYLWLQYCLLFVFCSLLYWFN